MSDTHTDADSVGAAAARPKAGGRNFTAATAVGLLLYGGVVVLAWWLPQLLVVAVMVASVFAVKELRAAFDMQKLHLMRVPQFACSILMPAAAYVFGLPGLMIAFACGIALVFAIRMFRGEEAFVRDVAANIFVIAYLPMLLSFVAMLLRPTGAEMDLGGSPLQWAALVDPLSLDAGHHGSLRLIVLLTLNVCADTAALFVGMAIGKHKLAPRVSPKKTWEGFIGSLVVAAAVGAWLLPALLDYRWWAGLLMGLVCACVAAAGDLCESMIKRDLGVKDMSSLLPGHGGIMDRLDSIMPNAFAVWLMFAVVL